MKMMPRLIPDDICLYIYLKGFIDGLKSHNEKKRIKAINILYEGGASCMIKDIKKLENEEDREISSLAKKAINKIEERDKKNPLNNEIFQEIEERIPKKLFVGKNRERFYEELIKEEIPRELKDYIITEPKEIIVEKLLREKEAFSRQKLYLQKEYPGSFVAIKDGFVVDYDRDRDLLGKRIYNMYGSSRPVLICHVDTEGIKKVSFRSPKVREKSQEKISPSKEIEPKDDREFWESFSWVEKHYPELKEKYPDKWVAVIDKNVVAYSESIKEVEEEAERVTKKTKEEIPVIFIEGNARIYSLEKICL